MEIGATNIYAVKARDSLTMCMGYVLKIRTVITRLLPSHVRGQYNVSQPVA